MRKEQTTHLNCSWFSAINPIPWRGVPDACIPAWLAFLASPLSWASFGSAVTNHLSWFIKAHQIASLTTRRCTNVDFLILLVSISSSYSLKGLGCNPLNPLLPQSSRQSNRSTGSNPRRVWFPPCLSLPSGPLPHRNRAAPIGPMKKRIVKMFNPQKPLAT